MWIRDAEPLPHYPEPYGLLLAILQDATGDWRGELWDAGDLGSDFTSWRSRPGGPSAGAIILHMINAEMFWFGKFALGLDLDSDERKVLKSDQIDADQAIWPDAPAKALSWYFELHDRYRSRSLELAQRWPEADARIGRENHRCSMRWVLGHVIQHEAYHGGQIVMLYDLWKHRDSGV